MEIHCDQLTNQHWIKVSQNFNFSMHSYEKVKLAVWIRFFDINSRRSDFYWPSNYNRRSSTVLKRWFGLEKCENASCLWIYLWTHWSSLREVYLKVIDLFIWIFENFSCKFVYLETAKVLLQMEVFFFDFKSKLKITVVPAIALLILPAFLKSFYFNFLNRKAIKWMII